MKIIHSSNITKNIEKDIKLNIRMMDRNVGNTGHEELLIGILTASHTKNVICLHVASLNMH